MYQASLTRISNNAKTGPIPVSTVTEETCPHDCAQKDTCYAKFGPIKIHWDHITRGTRGVPWTEFCEQISNLPKRQLWRHAQAGDLPGDGKRIDAFALAGLVAANKGKRGFAYTHYSVEDWNNLQCIEVANKEGFTVNISCNTLIESDRVTDITDAPQVVIVPSTEERKTLFTPQGRKVVICPTYYQEDRNCANCGICQDASPERVVIGFKAHGPKKKVINLRLMS